MAPTACLVSTIPMLEACLRDISSDKTTKLAIDAEGVKLSRMGKVSILQIFGDSSNTIWLVDITVLGRTAFDHIDRQGRNLRNILQNPQTRKASCASLLFDVRNDADALYNLFGVDLANVNDLQILEVAVQRAANIHVVVVSGLGKTIDKYLNPPAEWTRVKDEGVALFDPKKGGSYEIFEQRPLDPRIFAYAAEDVKLLFQLEAALERRLGRFSAQWKEKVKEISAARVLEAHKTVYVEKSKRNRLFAPKFNIWQGKKSRRVIV